jgi:predicted ferric reductase
MNTSTKQIQNASIVSTMAKLSENETHRAIKLVPFTSMETLECMDCGPFDVIDLEEAHAYQKTTQGDRNAPNQPHPALEYPIFYHALKRFPGVLESIKVPYAHRWRLSYPLQRKVTFSQTLLQLGVHLTWGELLLLVPFFAALVAGILYTAVYPSVKVTGKVARFTLIAAFVLAQRNSLVTLLVGMPVDRAIFYHKLAGRLGGVTGLLHTLAFFVDPKFRRIHQDDPLGGAFTGQVNASGSMLMLTILGIILSSLPPVRRRLFEAFYFLHLIFVAGLVVGTFFHTGKLVPILALLTWGVDLFVRKALMAWSRNPKKATLKILSDSVVQVSFPKTEAFAYNPGQYVYLSIPEISYLQWHPFSISSSPYQQVVTLHIRKAGNWTSALFQLASKKTEVDMLLEGPYGTLAVDIMGDRKYKSVMLISGGIGST